MRLNKRINSCLSRFGETSPPSQVYELDAATIPKLIRRALPNAAMSNELTWAVGLPTKIQTQIQQHLRRVDSGELHINRYQEVKHVPLG